MSQLYADAKTNLVVMNAFTDTIENNVESVFDFTVAEDVIVNFLKGSPAILGYDMHVGPWNHRGADRTVQAEGGQQWRETITDFQRPYLFHYQLTEFQGGALAGLADLATGQFLFMPYGPRTLLKWYYCFRPVDAELLPELQRFVGHTWYPWQQSYIEAMKRALAKDPWSP